MKKVIDGQKIPSNSRLGIKVIHKSTVFIYIFGLLLVVANGTYGQQIQEQSARALGFSDFKHFQQARSKCSELLIKNNIIWDSFNCGDDMHCLQRETKAMQRRYKVLKQSSTWINNKCDIVLMEDSSGNKNNSGSSSDSYKIELSYNNELFIINSISYKARTNCYNMEKGDEVAFVDGIPQEACTSTTVINLRTNDKCELRCN